MKSSRTSKAEAYAEKEALSPFGQTLWKIESGGGDMRALKRMLTKAFEAGAREGYDECLRGREEDEAMEGCK